jgi:hypothetical protein
LSGGGSGLSRNGVRAEFLQCEPRYTELPPLIAFAATFSFWGHGCRCTLSPVMQFVTTLRYDPRDPPLRRSAATHAVER